MKALVAIRRAGVEHHDFYDDDFCAVVVNPKNRYENPDRRLQPSGKMPRCN